VIEQFAGGVTADQLTLMELDDVAVAVRFAGAEGTAEQAGVAGVVTDTGAAAVVPTESTAATV
jgi:hypothetical protein